MINLKGVRAPELKRPKPDTVQVSYGPIVLKKSALLRALGSDSVVVGVGRRDDGQAEVAQKALFYECSLERHVPATHLLRAIDSFVDLSGIRTPP